MTEGNRASRMKSEFTSATGFLHGRRVTTATKRKIEVDHTPPEGINPAPDIGHCRWVVAMIEPRCEGKALQGFVEVGYPTFMPMVTRWRRKGFKQSKRAYPLFPGYIFVALVSGPKHSVKNCDSVSSVISDAAGPLYVRDSIVRALSDAMMRGEFDETITIEDRFSPGDVVTITDGPFSGMSAPISSLIDSDRVAVLLSILGAERAIQIDANHLRKTA